MSAFWGSRSSDGPGLIVADAAARVAEYTGLSQAIGILLPMGVRDDADAPLLRETHEQTDIN